MNLEQATLIKAELDKVGRVFGDYQNSVNLPCRSGCGKCCFKKDIFCTPIELLPLAIKLLDENRAEEVFDQCQKNLDLHCVLLKVKDEASGSGTCSEYEYRPFVCRTFAVAAKKNKYGAPEFSVCKIIKEDHGESFATLLQNTDNQIPYIELWKSRLNSLDPEFLEQEYPINKSLSMVLEKLLLIKSMVK